MNILIYVLLFVLCYYIYKYWKNRESFDNNCFHTFSPEIHIPLTDAFIETNESGNTSVVFNPVESVTITDFYNKSQLKDKINDQLNLFLKDPFDDNPFLNKDDCKISY